MFVLLRRTTASLICALIFALPAVADESGWIAKSNEHSMRLLNSQAQFAPESAAQAGVEGIDEEIIDIRENYVKRSNDATRAVVRELQTALDEETDARIRQDLQILIDAANQTIEGAELNQRYMLPYFNVAQLVFGSMQGLLDSRVDSSRYPAAVLRLRKYTGMESGYEPLTEIAKQRTSERFDVPGIRGPYKGELERDLDNSTRFIGGIRQLLAGSNLSGWQEPVELFEKQIQEYDAWLKNEIMKRARDSHQLPAELYAYNLRQFGVDITPRQMIDKAQSAYMEIRNEMHAIAPLVAEQYGWDKKDYKSVIRRLRANQLVGEEILAHYENTLNSLEKIIRRENVVTLPDRDAVIRLASEAETARIPAPHLQPPRLIGNTGEPAEFVLPLNMPAKEGEEALKFDDFTFAAMAWTLTVHEARPGHELQFSSIVENGVSTARVLFAFNSVNVEGWALYAEAEMKPYLPMDGQLISLQSRLLRAARAFLDPLVNLGEITPQDVKQFLMNEVVLSEAAANSERDRYSFLAPGQATSYFYGYSRLLETRAKAELALGDKFDRKAFHDFVLAQGLLPPLMLRSSVMQEFVPRFQ